MLLKINQTTIEYFDSFAPLSQQYQAFLVDIWGVLHDSATAYPGAVDCMHSLKQAGKKIILVSNAARRASILANELLSFDITEDLYDFIISSGELAWNAFFNNKDQRLRNMGESYYLLGSESYGLTDDLALSRTKDIAKADFIFNIGVHGNPTSTEAEEPILQEAITRRLTMICANPDLKVVRNGVLGIAAGAVAKRYEDLGGKVIYFGKPHESVYQRSFELLPEIPKNQVLAVGDALHTDIAGANNNGIDSALVATGIHNVALSELPKGIENIAKLLDQEKQVPTSIVKAFSW